MKSLTLKNLDLSKNELSYFEANIPSSLEVRNLKSVSYVIRWQLAKRRSGSAKVKTMSEISGTTAKPHKQKGSGRARQGSRRSVQFVGGRTCHGPTPRDFNFSIPKKIIKKALSDAIKTKLIQGKVITFSNHDQITKSSKLNSVLTNNKISKALLVCEKKDYTLHKFGSNLVNIKMISFNSINIYDIIKFDYLMVDKNTFQKNILGLVKQ
jgi:large subunit ribosomal protein L4